MLINNRKRNTILKHYATPGHPIAFSSRNKIQKYVKDQHNLNLTNDDVNKEILSYNHAYTLHRDVKKPKHYNPFLVISPRQQIQADLIDIQLLKRHNDGITFILVCIDVMTKKAWAQTMKSKSAETSKNALKNIFDEIRETEFSQKNVRNNKPIIKTLLFDKGTEFTNRKVKDLCAELNIKIIHPNSSIKAGVVERFNRTFQKLIYRYMTHKQTRKFNDVINELLKTYNNRKHRSISDKKLGVFSPNEAEKLENLQKLRNITLEKRKKILVKGRKIKQKFEIGDIVHIAKEKSLFARGYNETFNQEYFKIVEIKRNLPVICYKIQSLNTDEIIEGSFYNEELQLVKGSIYKIEKVLKERGKGRNKEYFVKWLNFDNRHNSWIPARNITTT